MHNDSIKPVRLVVHPQSQQLHTSNKSIFSKVENTLALFLLKRINAKYNEVSKQFDTYTILTHIFELIFFCRFSTFFYISLYHYILFSNYINISFTILLSYCKYRFKHTPLKIFGVFQIWKLSISNSVSTLRLFRACSVRRPARNLCLNMQKRTKWEPVYDHDVIAERC